MHEKLKEINKMENNTEKTRKHKKHQFPPRGRGNN
jgi:hypothetical protein